MAEIWGVAVAAVVGAGASAYAANRSASATRSAANSATGENARQFDTIRTDTAPQRQLGAGATGLLARLYGLPVYDQAVEDAKLGVRVGDADLPYGVKTVPLGNGRWDVLNPDGSDIGDLVSGGPNGRFMPNGTAIVGSPLPQPSSAVANPGKPDMSAFFESPDYQFNKDETQKALDRSLLARGRGLSGAGVREGERYASNLASGEFGNFFNRLTALAGVGQAATNTSAQAGLTTASNNSQILANAGNQRASAYMQGAEGVSNAVTGGLSNYLFLQQLNKNPYRGTGVISSFGNVDG